MTPQPKKFITKPEVTKTPEIVKPKKKTHFKRDLKIAGYISVGIMVTSVIGTSAYGIYSFNNQYEIKFQSPVRTPIWIEEKDNTLHSPLPEKKAVKNDSVMDKNTIIPKVEAKETSSNVIYEGKISHYSHAGCLGCGDEQIMGNGEKFDENGMTLAIPCEDILSKKYRYNTVVRVTNLDNGKNVNAIITDCGGFSKYNRVADLSLGMSRILDTKTDVSNVRIEKI